MGYLNAVTIGKTEGELYVPPQKSQVEDGRGVMFPKSRSPTLETRSLRTRVRDDAVVAYRGWVLSDR